MYSFAFTCLQEDFALVGSGGSLLESLRPQFKNDSLITNIVVNLSRLAGTQIVKEDAQIYTRGHTIRDMMNKPWKGYVNLVMLYEELNSIAMLIEEQKIPNSIILPGGVDLTSASYAWIEKMFGWPDEVTLDKILFIKSIISNSFNST